MQKIIGKLIMLVAIFCAISCGSSKSKDSDFAGTYKVEKKEGYNTPAFNLIIAEDGSVRAKIGKSETYGSWQSYRGAIHIWMEDWSQFS